MTKKEKKELLIKLICFAISKEDTKAVEKLFAELCYLDNYNYNYMRLLGALVSEEDYQKYMVEFFEDGKFKGW